MNFKIFISFLFLLFLSYESVNAGSVFLDDERSYPFIFLAASVDTADLNSGGTFTLYADSGSSTTATYRILSVSTTAGDSTSFTTGNRNLYIGTASTQRWTMSAATLGSVGSTSYTIGDGILPAFGNNGLSDSEEGNHIIIKYYGGTTDYDVGGTVVFHVVLVQTQD